MADSVKTIEDANAETFGRLLSGDPVLIDCIPAADAIPALEHSHILHAGPPIGWDRMCGPMRGAIAGIAVFEGWAVDIEDAERKAAAGTFRIRHDRT